MPRKSYILRVAMRDRQISTVILRTTLTFYSVLPNMSGLNGIMRCSSRFRNSKLLRKEARDRNEPVLLNL